MLDALVLGFPGSSNGEESACNAADLGSSLVLPLTNMLGVFPPKKEHVYIKLLDCKLF